MKIKIYSSDENLFNTLSEFKPDKKIDHIEIECDKPDNILHTTYDYFKKINLDIRLLFTDIRLMRIYPVNNSLA